MAPHDPEGTTIGPSPSKTSRNRIATDLASGQYPLLNAGWPQQVCFFGTSTSTPRLSITLTTLSATSG